MPNPSDARSSACCRADAVHRDPVTNAPLCVACVKLLGDFMRRLRSDDDAEYVALPYLRDLTFDEDREWWAHSVRR